MDVRYYIKYPGGREKIAENVSEEEAIEIFHKHWTSPTFRGGKWNAKEPKRVLVKEVREELLVEALASAY